MTIDEESSTLQPDEKQCMQTALEELEEESIRLLRWRDDLLENGNSQKADELSERIDCVEDEIAELEDQLYFK